MIGLTNAVGISHVAKPGYLSGLNNLKVFPMHNIQFADCFGFTESEVSILIQHNKKKGELEDDIHHQFLFGWGNFGGILGRHR